MTFKRVLVLLTLAAALVTPTLLGSGSYTSGAPRPNGAIDQARYNLGKEIYSGKTRLDQTSGPDLQKEQRERLESLQLRLPEKVQEKIHLTEFAGRLSSEQFEALEYFLHIRYRLGEN